MPQIRCPNCGMTISLKNRREADMDMITTAVRNGPRTFTYLLHATKLPRKTLSLRLKELSGQGTIAKNEGAYVLNCPTIGTRSTMMKNLRFPSIANDRRVRAGILLALLLITTPIAAQVLAVWTSQHTSEPVPVAVPWTPIGSFTVTLDANQFESVYAWEAWITYDASKLEVSNVDFQGAFPTMFPNVLPVKNNDSPGVLKIGSSLVGDVTSWSGSGKLATITFEFNSTGYNTPQLGQTKLCDILRTGSDVYPIQLPTEGHFTLEAE